MQRKTNLFFLVFGILFCYLFQPVSSQSVLIDLMEDELKREFEILEKQDIPVYYLSYRVTDQHVATIKSDFGNITSNTEYKHRSLSISCRVGDYIFDNTRENESGFDMNSWGNYSNERLPVENNDEVIRYNLWSGTDNSYKSAISAYKMLKSQQQDTVKGQDFSKEKAYQYEEKEIGDLETYFNREEWEEKIRNYSDAFSSRKDILEGSAMIQFTISRKYFVSTEGSKIIQNHISTRLSISGNIVAKDGDMIPLELVYYTQLPADLPSHDSILSQSSKLVDDLILLSKAPKAEPYTGPAILSEKASGVFFHEIFGHRIEGHRLNSKTDGQTFKSKLNKEVLSKNLSVISDPTINEFKGQYISGFYKYDEEGVPAQKVVVVDHGILKNFLMSRKPMDDFKNSNGHGRSDASSNPVSRQSNLFIIPDQVNNELELRKKLIRKCRKLNLEYGYYIEEVSGGFTRTDRYSPNAFNITPRKVYRVYVDGRPDELVRGVNLIGTPLVMFSEIDAAGDKLGIFNGICGAESGGVPVSTIAPSLLVNKIETQKKPEGDQKLPILPKPGIEELKNSNDDDNK